MIWIVSLNNSICHIYSYVPKEHQKEHQLTLLNTLENPSGQLKTGDLISDRPGHYQTMHSAKGAYEASSDAYEVEVNNFTKKLATLLKKGLNDHHYTQIILCAAPHIGGLLLNNLDKQVELSLLANIKKNFLNLDSSELKSYLKENWWEIIRGNKIS
jgi:protein required for attachment to host cells